MLSLASRKDVKLWDTTGELLETRDNAVFPARFYIDGSMVVTGGKNNTGYLWQIRR